MAVLGRTLRDWIEEEFPAAGPGNKGASGLDRDVSFSEDARDFPPVLDVFFWPDLSSRCLSKPLRSSTEGEELGSGIRLNVTILPLAPGTFVEGFVFALAGSAEPKSKSDFLLSTVFGGARNVVGGVWIGPEGGLEFC